MRPSTRIRADEENSSLSSDRQQSFVFPENHHLLITTPNRIFGWDSDGIHTLFASSKNSIVAAKEASDGSGTLAVADRNVVVLHNVKRGQDRTWGLGGDADEVRHLEYTTDAKLLYFSTRLTPDIQCYSTERARLNEPSRISLRCPDAFAISPTGHLIISASDDPKVVHIKNVSLNTPPTMFETGSDSGVNIIAFHPERPNVFLLAFQNGTVAAFDATKITRLNASSATIQKGVQSGEIGRLLKIHRAAVGASAKACITGAAFLPGYKTRAVSVGSDGKCRMIDFVGKESLLRTWNARAPATTLCVISLKPENTKKDGTRRSKSGHLMGGPTSTNNLIAIGREDGKVHLYDSVGILLCEKRVEINDERIISLQWVKGPSPRVDAGVPKLICLPALSPGKFSGDAHNIAFTLQQSPHSTAGRTRRASGDPVNAQKSSLEGTAITSTKVSVKSSKRFAIHPDEEQERTVRYTPSPDKVVSPRHVQDQYLDLFSPVKVMEKKKECIPRERVLSPPRSRPRISSKTFVQCHQTTSPNAVSTGLDNATLSTPRKLGLKRPRQSISKSNFAGSRRRSSLKVSPIAQRRQMAFASSNLRRSQTGNDKARAASSRNASVLANLRKMNMTCAHPGTGGSLSVYARSRLEAPKSMTKDDYGRSELHMFHRRADHVDVHKSENDALEVYEQTHKRQNWLEDSTQASSLEEDIWLTSDSNADQPLSRRRHRRATNRTATQHISISRLNKAAPGNLCAAEVNEGGTTAVYGNETATGTFSPSSKEVCDLFPRTSSLNTHNQRSPRKKLQRSPPTRSHVLEEMSLNTTYSHRFHRSKTRAEAVQISLVETGLPEKWKSGLSHAVHEEHVGNADQNEKISRGATCAACSRSKTQIHALEGEVAKLKGEMLALKAVIRRNGLAIPTSLK